MGFCQWSVSRIQVLNTALSGTCVRDAISNQRLELWGGQVVRTSARHWWRHSGPAKSSGAIPDAQVSLAPSASRLGLAGHSLCFQDWLRRIRGEEWPAPDAGFWTQPLQRSFASAQRIRPRFGLAERTLRYPAQVDTQSQSAGR